MTEEEKSEYLKHLELCEKCRLEWEEKKKNSQSVAATENSEAEKPTDNQQTSRAEEENNALKQPRKRWKYWKIALIITGSLLGLIMVVVLLFSLLFGAAGGSSSSVNNDAQYEYDQKTMSDSSSVSSAVVSPFSGFIQKISEGFISSTNLLLRIIVALIIVLVRLIPFAIIFGIGCLIFIKVRLFTIKRKK